MDQFYKYGMSPRSPDELIRHLQEEQSRKRAPACFRLLVFLVKDFKAVCRGLGVPAAKALEQLMLDFINDNKGKVAAPAKRGKK